eukprot:scaffold7470_cov296-Prasinococcus_capsulatus_cf.AAC.2
MKMNQLIGSRREDDRGRAAVLYRGVNTSFYNTDQTERENLRRRIGVSKDTAVILYADPLEPASNPLVFLAVMEVIKMRLDKYASIPRSKQRPSIRAYILGTGSFESAVAAHIRQYQLEDTVFMISGESITDLWKYYNIADIFFSSAQADVASNPLLQAMSMKLFPVVLKAGAVSEIVQDPVGVTIQAPEASVSVTRWPQYLKAAFADELEKVVVNVATLRAQYGQMCRDAVLRRFSGLDTPRRFVGECFQVCGLVK